MAERITVEDRDQATIVTMQDGKVNALSRDFLGELGAKLEKACAQERPVILTGSGGYFSAGLDLKEVPTLDEEGLRDLLERFKGAVKPILKAPVPVIAAIDGFAIAGGAIIALSCDYRVATPEAEIGATELQVGIPFPPTDLDLFTGRLPTRTIRRTILNPNRSKGEQALELGWVDELADDAVDGALAASQTLGGTNPAAFQDLKAQLNAPIVSTWDSFLQEDFDRYVDMLRSEQTQAAILEGIQNVMGD